MTSWFTAKCFFHARRGNDNSNLLSEMRYFLVRAEDEAEASLRAMSLAQEKEHSYRNAEGDEITWVFDSVLDIKELLNFTLSEGAEVYYEYLEA